MIHYHCLTCFIPNTYKEQVYDTTEFFPETLPLERMSSEDTSTHATTELIHELINLTSISPLKTLGNKHIEALKQIAEILNMAATPQDQPTPNPVTQNQKTPVPSLRVDKPEVFTAPPPRVDPPRRPPICSPHTDDI